MISPSAATAAKAALYDAMREAVEALGRHLHIALA